TPRPVRRKLRQRMQRAVDPPPLALEPLRQPLQRLGIRRQMTVHSGRSLISGSPFVLTFSEPAVHSRSRCRIARECWPTRKISFVSRHHTAAPPPSGKCRRRNAPPRAAHRPEPKAPTRSEPPPASPALTRAPPNKMPRHSRRARPHPGRPPARSAAATPRPIADRYRHRSQSPSPPSLEGTLPTADRDAAPAIPHTGR